MKNSENLENTLSNIKNLLKKIENIRPEVFTELTKEIEKIYDFKNNLQKNKKDLSIALDSLRDSENENSSLEDRISELENKIEKFEDNPLTPKTLYDVQKIEILENLYKNCTLEQLIILNGGSIVAI